METQITRHSIEVAAAAQAIYDLIADAGNWPYVFSPTVHAERVPVTDSEERLRLWAFANGEVRSWASQRRLDRGGLRIRFRQLITSPPVQHMGGEWILTPRGGHTEVVLLHDFRTDAASADWVKTAVDRNSEAELGALKRVAELGSRWDELVLTFADTVPMAAPIEPVYDFLYRADLWPQRLPHVSRLELTQPTPELQTMEMDTRAADGSVHTTKSVRVCFPHERIVYKQTATPEIMSAHVGEWSLHETGAGIEVASRHTVVIRPEAVPKVLGPEGTVAQARDLIKKALSTNSLTTLRHAAQHVEAAAHA